MTADRAKRRVGILGGMGPEATVLLMSRIIAMTPARDDADHVPLVIDNNTQVPSRIRALIEKTGEDPAPVLAAMARGLEASGAKALAMPCNTAHCYAPQIEQAVQIPLLNMVELSAQQIAARGPAIRKVGLLASPAVRLTGIFERAFEPFGIDLIYADDQDSLLRAIRAVKVDSRDSGAREALKLAAGNLLANGADMLLIACSELSIIADAIPAGAEALDTIDVLAGAVVEFAGTDAGRLNNGAAA